jgi:hypothetical protein
MYFIKIFINILLTYHQWMLPCTICDSIILSRCPFSSVPFLSPFMTHHQAVKVSSILKCYFLYWLIRVEATDWSYYDMKHCVWLYISPCPSDWSRWSVGTATLKQNQQSRREGQTLLVLFICGLTRVNIIISRGYRWLCEISFQFFLSLLVLFSEFIHEFHSNSSPVHL